MSFWVLSFLFQQIVHFYTCKIVKSLNHKYDDPPPRLAQNFMTHPFVRKQSSSSDTEDSDNTSVPLVSLLVSPYMTTIKSWTVFAISCTPKRRYSFFIIVLFYLSSQVNVFALQQRGLEWKHRRWETRQQVKQHLQCIRTFVMPHRWYLKSNFGMDPTL